MESKQPYQNFTELVAWQAARLVKQDIFAFTKKLPPEEKYRLADQLIRASRSVCANIAEGHGRYSYKDQLHFCIQARGSLSETMNHILDAVDCGYVSEDAISSLKDRIENAARLVNGYITFLRNNINSK